MHITVRKDEQMALGLVLKIESGRNAIKINHIHDLGCVHQWNSQHPSQEVRPGDSLMSVNGVSANIETGHQALLTELQASGRINLVVLRSPRIQDQASNFSEAAVHMRQDTLVRRDVVDALPKIHVGDLGDTSAVECSICLGEFDTHDDIMQLRCGHTFHFACAKQWLLQCIVMSRAKCPLCMQPFMQEDDLDENWAMKRTFKMSL